MSELARITLSDMGVMGFHGHLAAEKELGQRFELDVELYVDVDAAGESDNLDDAVNYEKVYKLVESIVADNRFNLLEALATEIADTVYEEFDVEGLTLRIRKPHVPYCPNLGHVEIEVERGRTAE
ncbi:MAG: dihydroneopterin aldolase [Gemmatimonadetes bacterium]|nr:dihydroneopterin aldolase [Gemmatimonadota bacterium]